jgi:hypothetical protein
MKMLHKAQAISLLIAGVILWIPLGISHMANMGIATAIILINAIIEWMG